MAKLCVFLLLGAAVNVAVAWGLAAYGPLWRPTYNRDVEPSEVARWVPRIEAQSASGHVYGVDEPGFHWHLFSFNSAEDTAFAYSVRTGWPIASMDLLLTEGTRGGVEIQPRSFTQAQDEISFLMWPRRLPTRPMPIGFAINTIFYATICWLLFAAPFAYRRRRRIKRGLCPHCKYPVGTSPVCTECGKAVKPKRAEAAS